MAKKSKQKLKKRRNISLKEKIKKQKEVLKKLLSKQKKLKPRKKRSEPLFTEFVHTKKVRSRESLRFRDKNGRLTKFDARKKLIVEIWLGNKKTNRVLNETKKKKPILQRFNKRSIRRKQLFLENEKKGHRKSSEIKQKSIIIDAHMTIMDNLESKIPELLDDCIEYTKRGNACIVNITIHTTNNEKRYLTFDVRSIIKETSPLKAALELARNMIHQLYINEVRLSGIDKTQNIRAKYRRSIKVDFAWYESYALKDM